MTSEDTKTPEVTPETSPAPAESETTESPEITAEPTAPEAPAVPASPEAPAEPAVPEAPTNEAPAATAPIPPAATSVRTPFRAPITNPRKYFLLSNIFRAVTVALMIVFTILSLYLPVFTVHIAEGLNLEDIGVIGVDVEGSYDFSVMDIISDLPDEIKLCYLLDEKNPEDWEEILEIKANQGDFSHAIDAAGFATALLTPEKSEWVNNILKTLTESRGLFIIPFFILLFPAIMVIGLAISTLVRLIQCIIGFFKPSTQIKKTDASSCIIITALFAIGYLISIFYSCFSLSITCMVILAAVSIAAIVMSIIYRKHTKEIVDAQFGL
ncbi:MAG: hypothetical protein ACI3YH_04240 [Eubacteriales bacterium]